jgi:hypothetical protein
VKKCYTLRSHTFEGQHFATPNFDTFEDVIKHLKSTCQFISENGFSEDIYYSDFEMMDNMREILKTAYWYLLKSDDSVRAKELYVRVFIINTSRKGEEI